MSFNYRQLHIKNEEGSGLILALMTLMVLSVLGASLGAITIWSYKLGDVNRDDTSAYYIAEAGANMAYEEMKNGVLKAYSDYPNAEGAFYSAIEDRGNENSIIRQIEKKSYTFSEQFGDKPTVKITISEPTGFNPKEYTILSTGEVAGKNRTVRKTVEVNWVGKDSAQNIYLPENASILSKSGTEVKNNGVTIIGDIHIDALGPPGFKATKEFEFNDIVYFHPDLEGNYNKVTQGGKAKKENLRTRDNPLPWKDYEKFVAEVSVPDYNAYSYVPNDSIYKDSNSHKVVDNGFININNYRANNYSLNLNDHSRGKKLTVSQDLTLNIDTNDKTINLVLDELDMPQGKINITGDGSLNLFVLNDVNFGGGSTVNKNGSTDKMNLYYFGSNRFTLAGSQYINGSVFIDQSDVTLTGSGNIGGNIVSNGENKIIEISGGSINNAFIFSPKSTVSLVQGAVVQGVVVADQIDLDGGAKIEFSEISTEYFPFKSSSGSIDNTEGNELIKTSPAIEPN